jgi:hypothetical protein
MAETSKEASADLITVGQILEKTRGRSSVIDRLIAADVEFGVRVPIHSLAQLAILGTRRTFLISRLQTGEMGHGGESIFVRVWPHQVRQVAVGDPVVLTGEVEQVFDSPRILPPPPPPAPILFTNYQIVKGGRVQRDPTWRPGSVLVTRDTVVAIRDAVDVVLRVLFVDHGGRDLAMDVDERGLAVIHGLAALLRVQRPKVKHLRWTRGEPNLSEIARCLLHRGNAPESKLKIDCGHQILRKWLKKAYAAYLGGPPLDKGASQIVCAALMDLMPLAQDVPSVAKGVDVELLAGQIFDELQKHLFGDMIPFDAVLRILRRAGVA